MGAQNLYLKSINLQAIPIIWEEDAEVVDTKKKRKVVTRKKKGDIDILGGGPANQKKAKRTAQPTSEIPIPHVKIVEDYDESDSWEQPDDYIRYEGTMSESRNYLVEYDLDDEDEEFLQDMNAKEEVLDENKFEFIVDLLERETFYNDHKVPTLDQAQHILQLPTEILQEIYKYWIEKREQTGPLVHRYSILRPDTPVDYTVFRKRSPYVKSTIRRDDLPSYKKMLKLRLQMEHARMLLETMIKREKAKREQTETLNEIINLQLQAAWPKKESKSKAKARTNSSRNKKTKSDVEESSSRSSRSRDSEDSDGPSSKKHKAIDASPPSSKAKAKATLLNTIHTSRLKHIL